MGLFSVRCGAGNGFGRQDLSRSFDYPTGLPAHGNFFGDRKFFFAWLEKNSGNFKKKFENFFALLKNFKNCFQKFPEKWKKIR